VKYVAGRMASGLPAHVDEADLISYGLVGLVNAIERFELEREIKFETYAITRIKGAIIDELRSLDWVPAVGALAGPADRAGKLEARAPAAARSDDEEMAAELEITVQEFQDSLLQISNSTIAALDELWTVSDASATRSRCWTRSRIRCARSRGGDGPDGPQGPRGRRDLAAARAREARVALYYYENLTLREIGEVLGVTESRISQLHTKAVLRLRGRLTEEDR
jgi:RNA polymerase sigma factor for flagellar operon FliA